VELFCFDINPCLDFLGQKVEKLDITDFDTTYKILTKLNPDVIIHTVSMTNVDKCEEDPISAYKINSIGTKNVAIAAQKFDSLMVYISTDYVFDGEKKDFYTEFDKVRPINVYGETKLQGENFVKQFLNRYLIIRTSWLFGKNRDNYITCWYNSIVKNEKPVVVERQFGSPTYTKDLSEYIKNLIFKNKIGLYNVVNKGGCSRLEVLEEIYKNLGVEFDLKKIDVVEAKKIFKKAKRPIDTRLKDFVLELEGEVKIRSWREALKDFLKEKYGF